MPPLAICDSSFSTHAILKWELLSPLIDLLHKINIQENSSGIRCKYFRHKQKVKKSPFTPLAQTDRPPRKGPMLRHFTVSKYLSKLFNFSLYIDYIHPCVYNNIVHSGLLGPCIYVKVVIRSDGLFEMLWIHLWFKIFI